MIHNCHVSLEKKCFFREGVPNFVYTASGLVRIDHVVENDETPCSMIRENPDIRPLRFESEPSCACLMI